MFGIFKREYSLEKGRTEQSVWCVHGVACGTYVVWSMKFANVYVCVLSGNH